MVRHSNRLRQCIVKSTFLCSRSCGSWEKKSRRLILSTFIPHCPILPVYIRLTRHLRAKVLKGEPHKQPLPLFFSYFLFFGVSAWILASPRAVPELATLKSKLDKKRNELCNIMRARAKYINLQEDVNINATGGAHPTACAGDEGGPQLRRTQVGGVVEDL